MRERKFVTITNKPEYQFRLEMDDIKGIIRLTKNDIKKDTTKITNRNIPITADAKWDFHRTRTGYSEIKSERYNFIGSYVDRDETPMTYELWKRYILDKYKKLKIDAIDK